MTKYICDRCGKEIEGVFFKTRNRILKGKGEFRYSQNTYYDLCVECYHEFLRVVTKSESEGNK